MRRITKTITEINSETGFRVVLCKNEVSNTVFFKTYFKDEPVSNYDLTHGDIVELIYVLQEFINA